MFQLERNFLKHTLLGLLGVRSCFSPLLAYVYLTYRCNLHCIYCDDGKGTSYPDKTVDYELGADDWLRVFKILRRETDGIIFTGGEPLVRDDLEYILAGTKKLGYRKVVLLTNGLTLERSREALKHIDILMISLDTMDFAKADYLMGGTPGAARKIFDNIIMAHDLSAKLGFKLYFNVCIRPENVNDVHDVIDFCCERRIGFVPLPAMEKTAPNGGLVNNSDYRKLVSRIIKLKKSGFDVMGSMGYIGGIMDFTPYRCHPTLLIRVQPSGRILYPCNKLNQEGGDILRSGSYRKALQCGMQQHGRFDSCPHSCQVGCYMDFSVCVDHPALVLGDYFYKLKGTVKSWRGEVPGRARPLGRRRAAGPKQRPGGERGMGGRG